MNNANSDLPAMPLDKDTISALDEGHWFEWLGLTKREHFAGLAMQGLLANEIPGPHRQPDSIARTAICMADALLKALEGEP